MTNLQLMKANPIILLFLLLISCGNDTNDLNNNQLVITDKRVYIIAQEVHNSRKYIGLRHSATKEILRSGYSFNFRIRSKTKYITYRDIKLRIDYLSRTGGVLRVDTVVIPDTLAPKKSMRYKHYAAGNVKGCSKIEVYPIVAKSLKLENFKLKKGCRYKKK